MARNFYLTKTYFYRNNPYLCTRIPIKLDLNRLERHNHPPHFHLIYKGICAAQGNDSFSCNNSLDNGVAIKNTLKNSLNYLAIPNNLLLSLSLSLSHIGAPPLISHKQVLLYARVKRCAIPIDKGLAKVPFVCFVVFAHQVSDTDIRENFYSLL